MPKFELACQVTVSAYTTVDAPDLDAAMKIAEDRIAVIGGANSGESEDENWIIDEADGTPDNIHLSHSHED